MAAFSLFKYLHILMMFAAVAGAVIPEVVLHLVANTRDTRAIATFGGIAQHIGKALPVFFVGGAIFGLLAAWTGQMDFLQPWLVATYVLFIGAMLTGALVTDGWVARLTETAAASGTSESPGALDAVIDDRRAKLGSAWLMLTIVIIIFLMVVQPGG